MKPQIPVSLAPLIRDVLNSDSPLGGRRFWWQRPAVLAVDQAGDVAAALLWRPGGVAGAALFERYEGRWRAAGGGDEKVHRRRELLSGRPRAETAGPAHVLTIQGGSSVLRRRGSPGNAGLGDREYVACLRLRLAREVDHLDVDGRRITVSAHGHAVVVWNSPHASIFPASSRPPVAACRQDGTVLSELAPSDFVDSATLRTDVA